MHKAGHDGRGSRSRMTGAKGSGSRPENRIWMPPIIHPDTFYPERWPTPPTATPVDYGDGFLPGGGVTDPAGPDVPRRPDEDKDVIRERRRKNRELKEEERQRAKDISKPKKPKRKKKK